MIKFIFKKHYKPYLFVLKKSSHWEHIAHTKTPASEVNNLYNKV